jgi:DNA repair protein RadD
VPDKRRDEIIKAYARGDFQILVNKDMFTTGHDVPEIDFIDDKQGTRSTAKHVQKYGRGTRPAPWVEKKNCLVADFARNCEELGPINDPVLPTPRRKRSGKFISVPRKARIKWCANPACKCSSHISATVCEVCLTEFPLIVKLADSVGTAEAMRLHALPAQEVAYKPDIATIKVDLVTPHVHEKKATGNRSIRFTYLCGLRTFTEYLCVEYEDAKVRRRAEEWWREKMPGTPLPRSAYEALKIVQSPAFPIPTHIRVWANQKTPTVVNHVYE